METKHKKTLLLTPLLLTLFIVLADQISKVIVLRTIPPLNSAPGDIIRVVGDFFWLINVHNRGAMFSLGSGLVGSLRHVLLILLPIALIAYMISIVVYSSWDTKHRWIAATIVGGGIGNMLDRLFREKGVVDFLSIKFYGLFGFERWPTFNLADTAIVISMLFWLVFSFWPETNDKEEGKKNE